MPLTRDFYRTVRARALRDHRFRAALLREEHATEHLANNTATEHRFTPDDIRNMHRAWLGEIYPWAGEYRQINVGKGDFMFAAARQIPALMIEYGAGSAA